MIRFYAPDILSTGVLPADESGHCIRVLRRRVGDDVEVVDGKGNLYKCRIIADDHRSAALEIVSSTPLPKVWKPEIVVAVAPTKNVDRIEWLVEKLVELGIDRIVPLRCARSERKDIKPERIERIAVSAMKQSLKAILPRIDATMPIDSFLTEQTEAQRFVGYCDADTPRLSLAKAYVPNSDVRILIGPEGDFDPGEIQRAIATGYIPVTMGDNRLRTETAALMAAATIHTINQLCQ